MQVAPNQDVVFAIDAVQVDGVVITPVAARMRVLGPSGVLADWQTLTLGSTPEYTITVPALLNALAAGATREARLVQIEIDGGPAIGPQRVEQDYLIVLDDELVLMVNSFQNYVSTLTYASQLLHAENWEAASADQRKTALVSAFQDLVRMNYDLAIVDRDDVWFKTKAGYGFFYTWFINKFWLYSAEDYRILPAEFREKLQLAQVIEANARLARRESAEDWRAQGIVTQQVGPNMTTLRQGKPRQSILARETMLALRPYLRTVTRVTRS